QSVCCLPVLVLRLTARLKLATRCSPTSFRTTSLPTNPVICTLMLLPISNLQYDLRLPFIACWRFLTRSVQVRGSGRVTRRALPVSGEGTGTSQEEMGSATCPAG